MELPLHIRHLIDKNDIEAAIVELDGLVGDNPDDSVLLFERGRLHWSLGHRRQAMTDYARAAAIDPDSPAVQALAMARDVMSFFNPDLYNP